MTTFTSTLIFLLYVSGKSITGAQSISDLCSMQLMVSGVNYFSHPIDCDKFVQCHQDARGRLVGEIQQCAFSTYWSSKFLTCLPAEDVQCASDKCFDQPDGFVRGGEGNCRGYWECKSGKSRPLCCPVGQRFDDIAGCVDAKNDEYECKDMCFNEVKEISNDTSILCEKRAVIGDSTVYEQELAGWGWMKLPCAPGTVFNQDLCECTQVSEPVQKAVCKPEIYLPFTVDHSDMSGKGYYVGNENVIVKNGAAHFNGRDSRLIIPRFNNIEHQNTVVIDILYRSNHTQLQESQAIVSNSDCNILPSIFISEDDQAVTFGVGTTKQFLASTNVAQTNDNIKRLRYKLAGSLLKGEVNGQSTKTNAEGFVRHVQCALSVGHSANMAAFSGQIDEFTVYLCSPEGKNSQPDLS